MYKENKESKKAAGGERRGVSTDRVISVKL
jgi:hypothetical protein